MPADPAKPATPAPIAVPRWPVTGIGVALIMAAGFLVALAYRAATAPAPKAAAAAPCEPCEAAQAGPRRRGRVQRPDLAAVKAAYRRRAALIQAPPPATEADFDSRTLGIVGPIKDQGGCGSCWDFSGTGVCEIAFNKSGVGGGAASFVLSEQYTLDCYRTGRCGGDDNTTVLDHAKSVGLPLAADYGAYSARGGRCQLKAGAELHRITDWGFADGGQGQGVTSVAAIKAAIKAYGAVGCGIAANGAFEGWGDDGASFDRPFRGGGFGQRVVNHDVILLGWHDDARLPGGGYWILRNSWGSRWGVGGYAAICYGANMVGSEAVFAVGPPAPAPPPTPPAPPTPPTPPPAPSRAWVPDTSLLFAVASAACGALGIFLVTRP